ncbi:hypothetical protein LEP1GSC041_1056 [Leptospira noguchii str. 2006001870]|nr:hypothetical protein LEP1GSC041_1056 [Leptospira noguchii str. 2006001870]
MNYIPRFEKKGQVIDTAAMTDAANELKLADITNINAYNRVSSWYFLGRQYSFI